MSSVIYAPSDRIIYRKSVMFCVLPTDLSRHLNELRRYCADREGVEVVIDCRGGTDRRQSMGEPPGGIERRVEDRRRANGAQSAAEVGFDLPRSLRRHAGRIMCTWRSLPVHFQDAAHEADLLLAAADTDPDARDELRLRYYPRVYANIDRGTTSSRRKVALAESVFEDLFAHHQTNAFSREVSSAATRVTANRRSRQPPS